MISFIVIGKNIEKTIDLCIESINNYVKANEIFPYEIIYVDSGSVDETINIAQRFRIRILQIQGEANAAIGRNAGALHAKYDILFFIDGDMEILSEFYEHVFDKTTRKLMYPFVNGYLLHRYYDGDFNYLYTRKEKTPQKPVYRNVTGGLMIVERKLWEKSGGMDERMVRNQDLDFGLRLSELGYPALLDNHLMAVHHTITYSDKSRAFDFYFSKALLSPGLLMRKHFLNILYLKRHYQSVVFVSMLIVMIISLFFNKAIALSLLTLYVILQLIKSIRKTNKKTSFLLSLTFKVLYNFYSLTGLLFFYPGTPVYKVVELDKHYDKKNIHPSSVF